MSIEEEEMLKLAHVILLLSAMAILETRSSEIDDMKQLIQSLSDRLGKQEQQILDQNQLQEKLNKHQEQRIVELEKKLDIFTTADPIEERVNKLEDLSKTTSKKIYENKSKLLINHS